MSRNTAAVRFPDGTVRYGIYNGTGDILCRALFATDEEAWDAWRFSRGRYGPEDAMWPPGPDGDEQRVDVWDGRQSFESTAAANMITGPTAPPEPIDDEWFKPYVYPAPPAWLAEVLPGDFAWATESHARSLDELRAWQAADRANGGAM